MRSSTTRPYEPVFHPLPMSCTDGSAECLSQSTGGDSFRELGGSLISGCVFVSLPLGFCLLATSSHARHGTEWAAGVLKVTPKRRT